MTDIEDLYEKIQSDKMLKFAKELHEKFEPSSSLELIIRQLAKTYKIVPKKSVINVAYQSLVRDGIISPNKKLLEQIKCRTVRSASGVLPVTTVMRPDEYSCGKDCAYCPDERKVNGAEYDMPRSYLSSEPAVKRAMQSNWFDCYTQVISRLNRLESNGHVIDKIEMIVEGGTFSHYPKQYQEEYIRDLYYSCNVYKDTNRERYSLDAEKLINETAECRIIGLVLETRPDCINKHEIKRFRRFGCTRVQIGVQHTNNDVLTYNERGHYVEDSIAAMKMLKDNGFKVDMHIMPDMPGSTPELDKQMFDFIFDTPHLRADYAKIYPCLDVKYSRIREWKESGRWSPYSEQNGGQDLISVLLYMKKKIPRYLRINRLQRDFPEAHDSCKNVGYISENIRTNLRQILLNRLTKEGFTCKCIRCREVGTRVTDLSLATVKIEEYDSSDGKEFFISFVNEKLDVLYGFVRLRFPSNNSVFKELDEKTALIRELHVYGSIIDVKSKAETNKVQHYGFGKKLMKTAESIAYRNGYSKIAVISGVGVREYYRKMGYSLSEEGEYMMKSLEQNNYLFLLCLFALVLIFLFI